MNAPFHGHGCYGQPLTLFDPFDQGSSACHKGHVKASGQVTWLPPKIEAIVSGTVVTSNKRGRRLVFIVRNILQTVFAA